jgi:hypothetical protein
MQRSRAVALLASLRSLEDELDATITQERVLTTVAERSPLFWKLHGTLDVVHDAAEFLAEKLQMFRMLSRGEEEVNSAEEEVVVNSHELSPLPPRRRGRPRKNPVPVTIQEKVPETSSV